MDNDVALYDDMNVELIKLQASFRKLNLLKI